MKKTLTIAACTFLLASAAVLADSATQIQITFDPAGTEKSRFSFSPVRSVMNYDTQSVIFKVSTRGGNGRIAQFAEARGSRFSGPFASGEDLHQGPEVIGLTETSSADRTTLKVTGFPVNDTGETQVFEYVVTVEYDGTLYSSRPGYPSTSCLPNPGK